MKREILFRGKRVDNGEWVGKRNGNLEILSFTRKTHKDLFFNVKCDCGLIYEMSIGNFKRSVGVGCKNCRNEKMRSEKFIHGMTDTRLHIIWQHMVSRCENPSNVDYKNYGGRGISICNEWKIFIPFYEWSMKNGYSNELSIDRIDVNGNYSPHNCRWATSLVQNNNRRNNILYTINNESNTLRNWCTAYNSDYALVKGRVKRGLDLYLALTTERQRPFGIKKLML